MNRKNLNLELLAPAGNVEKMKYAFHYGADAVYAGLPDFSLRARINDFNIESLEEGVKYAHKIEKKFYVTLNIYAHNQHLKKLESHLKELSSIDIDGVILSDPGILDLVKEHLPKVEIHLSTQANATNWRAVKFWADRGVKRIVLAREVTLDEIREIHQKVPDVELEYFIHGAMCMSYSGRCMLSKWMSGRSANLGDCSQPCRWAYNEKKDEIKEMKVEDHKKEFEMDLEEDKHGTYFFNSKDLNLLAYLNDLAEAGVTSFKVEGRNKSVYYLAVVMRAYRNTLNNLNDKKIVEQEQKNLNNLVHRGYTTGFLLGTEPEHNFKNSHNSSKYEFVGEVLEVENEKIKIKAHNAIYEDDEIEIIDKEGNHPIKIIEILDEDKKKVESAHGGHDGIYYLKTNKEIKEKSLIRKTIKNNNK